MPHGCDRGRSRPDNRRHAVRVGGSTAAAAAAAAVVGMWRVPVAGAFHLVSAGAGEAPSGPQTEQSRDLLQVTGASLTGGCAALPEIKNYFFSPQHSNLEPMEKIMTQMPSAPSWFEPCGNPSCARTCNAVLTYEASCEDGMGTRRMTGAPSFPLCVPDECAGTADLATMARDMQARWHYDLLYLHACGASTARRRLSVVDANCHDALQCTVNVVVNLDCAPWGGSVKADGTSVVEAPARVEAPSCATSQQGLNQGDTVVAMLAREKEASSVPAAAPAPVPPPPAPPLAAAVLPPPPSLPSPPQEAAQPGGANGGVSDGGLLPMDWGVFALAGTVAVAALYAFGVGRSKTEEVHSKEGFVAPSFQEAHFSHVGEGWRPMPLPTSSDVYAHAGASPVARSEHHAFEALVASPAMSSLPVRPRQEHADLCCGELQLNASSSAFRPGAREQRAYLQTEDNMEGWWAARRKGYEDRGPQSPHDFASSPSRSPGRGYRDYMDKFSQEARDSGHLGGSPSSLGNTGAHQAQTLRAMLAPLEERRWSNSSPLGGSPQAHSHSPGAALRPASSFAESAWSQSQAPLPRGSIEV